MSLHGRHERSAFPHCDGVAEERPDPKTPLSTQIPTVPADHDSACASVRPPHPCCQSHFYSSSSTRISQPQQYMEQFADDFVFTPDDEDKQLYPEFTRLTAIPSGGR